MKESFFLALEKLRMEFRSAPYFWSALFGVVFIPLFATPLSGEATKTSLVLIFAGWTLWRFRKQENLLVPGWLLVFLFIFLACVCVAALLGPDIWQAVFGRNARYNNSVALFASWSVILLALVDGWKRVNERVVLHSLAVCALAIALFGLLQAAGVGYFSGIQSLIIPQLDRVPSFVGNPNFSALVVAVFWPASALLALTSRTRLEFWYLLVSVLIMWASLGVFASRGALLGAGAAVLCLLPFLWQRWGRKITAAYFVGMSLLVLLAFAWAFLYHPGIKEGLNAQEQNTASRIYVWSESLLMLETHPWFGVGPGQFLTEYMQTSIDPVPQDGWFDDPHNLLLHLASTLGLPAVLAFACLIGLALFAGLRKSWKNAAPGISGLFGLSGLIAFLLASMFNPITVSLWVVLAALIAASVSGIQIKEENIWSRRFLPTWLLGLVGSGLMLTGIAWMSSDYAAGIAANYYRARLPEQALLWVKFAKAAFPAHFNARLISASASLADATAWEEARSDLLFATRRYPLDPIVQLQASRVWWMRYERYKDEEARVMSGVLAHKAAVLTPTAPDPLTMLGFFALAQGDIEKAETLLNKAIVLDKDDVTSWQLLAAVYQRQGRRGAMLGALKHLIRLRPFSSGYKKARDVAEASENINAVNLQVSGMEVFF